MLKLLVALFGALVGLIGGAWLVTLLSPVPDCVISVGDVLNPLIGAAFGLWYGPVYVQAWSERLRRPSFFAPSPEWHQIVDSAFGLWIGYLFVSGLAVAFAHYTRFTISEAAAVPIVVLGPMTFGVLFYWSTTRWLAKRGQLA